MHYRDLQDLDALIRSKVCTMLLGWDGGLHTVTVIRQPRHQQNSGCQFHVQFGSGQMGSYANGVGQI